MANRSFNRHQSLEKEIKTLQFKITTDGSGDVSSVSGLGLASAVHSSNAYTLTLEDGYVEFKHLNAISSVSADYKINSEAVKTAKTIEFESSVLQASTVIYVSVQLKNSSAR